MPLAAYSTHYRKQNRRALLYIRWAFTLCVAFLLFLSQENETLEELSPSTPPVLYSTICQDNLERLFIDAINGTEESIFLAIYSLTDKRLIEALNTQGERGVSIEILYDPSTPLNGIHNLSPHIKTQGVKLSGLMHQKILVVDSEKVWIGSANMTLSSLKWHDNLVIGLINTELAEIIRSEKPFATFQSGGQQVEFWSLPQKGKEGLQRILSLIQTAKKTIRVAMFTWTHVGLTQAIIQAYERGVEVEVILDHGQARGVCRNTLETLVEAGIPVRLSSGRGLMHHKFVWIDEEYLANGSANWTKAAFTRNRDCFLILHALTVEQNAKMRELWKKTRALSQQECSATLPPLAEAA